MTTKNLSKKAAEQLWSDLRDHFVSAEKVIKTIIEKQAWVPLGYASFAEAWLDRMADVPLATDAARAHVVYALYDAGYGDEVALSLPGVGPVAARRLREQRADGVPADRATTVVRTHLRRPPVAPHVIKVSVTAEDYTRFKEIAAKAGVDFELSARAGLVAHFAELAARVEAEKVA